MTSPRRTFAIISHPDAGKTTLTEKLLYFGGAIHLAGEVKARGQNRRARSDWMKIEQQRGISVTSSVMTFERDGITFNLLDTPGHEDFQRGHLSHADRGRFRGHGDRRRQGHRAADAQIVRGLPAPQRPDHHLRQQGRPRRPPGVRTARRDRRHARARRLPDELAGRDGRRVPGRARTRHQPDQPPRRRQPHVPGQGRGRADAARRDRRGDRTGAGSAIPPSTPRPIATAT